MASGRGSRSRSDAAGAPSGVASGVVSAGILGGGLAGALLLVVAELTTLFEVHVAGTTTTVKSVSSGSHHSYAIALIAGCAAVLTIAAWRTASRPALLAIGILGVTALVIALVVDLPDATATGLVLTSSSHYLNASAKPRAGFYLETLGAVVLMFTSLWGPADRAGAGPGAGGGIGASADAADVADTPITGKVGSLTKILGRPHDRRV